VFFKIWSAWYCGVILHFGYKRCPSIIVCLLRPLYEEEQRTRNSIPCRGKRVFWATNKFSSASLPPSEPGWLRDGLHYVMVIGLSEVCNHTSDHVQRESDLFITSMITDRIGRREVLLPINHENYNFREKKNSQVMKEREIWIKRLSKEA